MKFAAICLFVALTGASASEFSLTPDNWDSLTSGKTIFVKFQAPW